MPTSRIRPLDFNHGLEDVEPFQQEVDRPRLPPSELLQPSTQGPASPIEELLKTRSFGDALDSSIRPAINDLSICRPERYGRLLAEAQEILGEAGERTGDPDIDGLSAVLDRQSGLRDLLGYYLQSLLNA
jgi:hypothetical protein